MEAKHQEPIELDGRTLEGGGQLIRIALCLSALTGIPVKINNIRGNRSGGGGLKAQHLACVKWLAHATNAQVEGAVKGSKTLSFRPGQIQGDLSPAFKKRKLEDGCEVFETQLDIGTAGSTGLALQAILPYILFTKFPAQLTIHLKLSGGTNVWGAPSFEYIKYALLPTLSRIGLPEIKATLHKRGWSQGGSSIGAYTLEIPPRPTVLLPSFEHSPSEAQDPNLPPLQPSNIQAIFLAPPSCHEHLETVLRSALTHHFSPTLLDEEDEDAAAAPQPSTPPTSQPLLPLTLICEPTASPAHLSLHLTATFPSSSPSESAGKTYSLSTSSLSTRKISSLPRAATSLAERAAAALAAEWRSHAWADEHMRDQLVIFQALAEGRSRVFAGFDHDDDDEEQEAGARRWRPREPSLHARTAEWVARRMVGARFDAEGACKGCGFGGEEAIDGAVRGVRGLEVG